MNPKRKILFLIWLMMTVAYFDRVNISLAGPSIMTDLHLSKRQFGGALAAFQVGYALMQAPGGFIADTIGARPLLIAALAVWSAFTALTGTVRSLPQMVAVRVLFGLGEGIENGAQFKLIADHFDSGERSEANALFLTALAIGPAIAAPIVTSLIGWVGWRGLFFYSALPGIIVAGLLYAFLPGGAKQEGRQRSDVADAPPRADAYKIALAQPASWLSWAAYLFFNIGFWGFVSWMPTYLHDSRNITLSKLGWLSAIPFVCGFFGLLAIGYLGSHGLRRYRAALVAAVYVLAAAFLYAAFSAQTLSGCMAALSGAAFFLYGGFGPFWAVVLDLCSEEMRGAFSGFVNLGGQIGGIVTPLIVGVIFDATHSFTGGFLFMMSGLFLAAICLTVLQNAGFPNKFTDKRVQS